MSKSQTTIPLPQKFRLLDKVRVRQHPNMPAWATDWRGVDLTVTGVMASKRHPGEVEYWVNDGQGSGDTDGFFEWWLEHAAFGDQR